MGFNYIPDGFHPLCRSTTLDHPSHSSRPNRAASDISLDSDRSFNCQSAGLGRYNRAAASGTETGHVTNRPTPAGRLLGLGMGNNGNGPRSPACSHHEDWVGE